MSSSLKRQSTDDRTIPMRVAATAAPGLAKTPATADAATPLATTALADDSDTTDDKTAICVELTGGARPSWRLSDGMGVEVCDKGSESDAKRSECVAGPKLSERRVAADTERVTGMYMSIIAGIQKQKI